eukprot:2048201-Prorocentrum_lima.AAC.1
MLHHHGCDGAGCADRHEPDGGAREEGGGVEVSGARTDGHPNLGRHGAEGGAEVSAQHGGGVQTLRGTAGARRRRLRW